MSAALPDAVMEAVSDDVGEMLRKSVQDFCARYPGPVRMRRLRETKPGHDKDIWRQMVDAGWMGIALPEESGGLGLGLAEICIVAEELAADLSPEPFAAVSIAGLAIAGGDNGPLVEKLLEATISGALLPAFAWQEKVGSLDMTEPQTRLAKGSDDRYRLTGAKRFVPAAGGAGGFAVTAMSQDGPAIVWVERGVEGMSLRAELNVDGSYLHAIEFDGAVIDDTAILASAGAAGLLLPRLLDQAAVIASAELLGIMRAAFDLTMEYVGQRKQFGKPIGSFQVLQHRLVDLWMQRELLRACLEEAIAAASRPDVLRRSLTASAVKARASAGALQNGRQSIQIHGAIGYADEHDIGLYLKRAIVKSAWLGNAPIHRQRYAALSGLTPAGRTGEH
jgi:alkylation response protein AidB-like acyl-CoA dehydrogenase